MDDFDIAEVLPCRDVAIGDEQCDWHVMGWYVTLTRCHRVWLTLHENLWGCSTTLGPVLADVVQLIVVEVCDAR